MIEIKHNPKADTRTCNFLTVTKQELLEASIQHIDDVRRGLAFFREELYAAAVRHDADKLTDIDGFHADFATGFAQTGWYDRHRKLNRHHLQAEDGVPEDVDLIDVLDFIADNVMAGMARSGEVRPLELPAELLQRAVRNTAAKLAAQVMVIE